MFRESFGYATASFRGSTQHFTGPAPRCAKASVLTKLRVRFRAPDICGSARRNKALVRTGSCCRHIRSRHFPFVPEGIPSVQTGLRSDARTPRVIVLSVQNLAL